MSDKTWHSITLDCPQMPPVAGIAPPTMAPVMRNLQGLTTRESAPQLPQSSPARSTAPVRGTEAQRDGGARTGKMRRERQHYSSKKVSQDEEVSLGGVRINFCMSCSAKIWCEIVCFRINIDYFMIDCVRLSHNGINYFTKSRLILLLNMKLV